MAMRILAADIGFGYSKATDDRHFQAFKPILGEASTAAFDESLLAGQEVLPGHVEIDGTDVFVGELAEAQSRERGFTLDSTQFLGHHAKVLALAPLVDHVDPFWLVQVCRSDCSLVNAKVSRRVSPCGTRSRSSTKV